MEHINLEKLRAAVDGIRAMNIPRDKFDMETYGFLHRTSFEFVSKQNIHTCNTTACFLGWMPLVKGLEPSENCFTDGKCLDFHRYSIEILGLEIDKSLEDNLLWEFLFSGVWVDYAPTLEDALERAEIVLNREYKENWEFEDYKRY